MLLSNRLRLVFCIGLALWSAEACSSSDPAPPPAASSGASAVAGATASHSGASSVPGAGAGGAATSAGAAGSNLAGGSAQAGGGSPSQGGGGAGGAAESAGGGGANGGSGSGSPPVPSAGCGKGGRPAGGVITVDNDHIYTFPESYDGTVPMPMLVGFHANNNPMNQIRDLASGTKLATAFVGVYPKSAGSGWNIGTDAAPVTTVFNDVLSKYCVDTSRVFATGHSSGAQMVVQMLCASGGEKRFKAVAPVAASKYCAKVSPIPIMYIQGKMDAMRGNGDGADVVAVFSSSNTCMSGTSPYTAVSACNSTFDGAAVNAGCISYLGCSKPTVWCSHNDNGYNSTDGHMHGWPCFASQAMADFFLSLP